LAKSIDEKLSKSRRGVMRVSIAAILSAFALLCLAPTAFAADDDKDKAKPAAEQLEPDKATDEEKLPEGATESKDGEEKLPEGTAEVKEGAPEGPPPRQGFGKPLKKKSAEAPPEEAAQGNATGESKSGASMKDLVNDGFVIRTTVFIPAEAVTRQLGKVSGDAVVVTLQKQFSTAICYYGFKAYVGAGLTKIASCTVHQ
jgi:hypothetical protein